MNLPNVLMIGKDPLSGEWRLPLPPVEPGLCPGAAVGGRALAASLEPAQ